MAKVDAIHQPRPAIIPSVVIDEQILKRLEADMDKYERISCLFLITEDYKHGYEALIDHWKNSSTMISDFIYKYKIADWHDKIVEALCLLQNHEILLNLGILPDDAKVIFATNILKLNHKINKYAKAFYCLFENFSNHQVSDILARVYQNPELPRPNTHTWPDEKSLELHMLWWVQRGFVDISADNRNKWKLKKFLNVLKALELTKTDAYETLKSYEDSEDNEPCRYDDRSTNKLSPRDGVVRDNSTTIPNRTDENYEIHRGLTIVFNQMKFPRWTKYEHRHGSDVDRERIKKIFQETFGFEVESYDNLDREKIYDILDSLRDRGEKYDCIVVFVLSHGTRGTVIASDGGECPIDEIREKMCTGALDGKPKILIIQACQKQDFSALTTDGPVGSCPRKLSKFRDFILLSSTIPGELSVRDCREGTWYIQILCDVLEERGGRGCCITECALEVNRRISCLREIIDGSMIEQVPMSQVTLLKKLILPNRTRRVAKESCK